MSDAKCRAAASAGEGPAARSHREFGLSLSAFFVSATGFAFWAICSRPGFPVQHAALSIFLPGFALLSWHSFFLGLVESFPWGWYIALLFGLLYNFFLRRVG